MTTESSGDAEPNDPTAGRETSSTLAALDPTRIPAALRERPQWVCWKYVTRGGKPHRFVQHFMQFGWGSPITSLASTECRAADESEAVSDD